MGVLAFLASIIGSLAWPIALFAIVWLFRKRLEDLLPRLRVRYKDFETSFRLDQAEKEAAALPPAPIDLESEPTPEEKDRFEKISEISPRAAIMDLRRELEHAVKNIAEQYGLPLRPPASLISITRMLRSRGVIDPHTSALLDDLRVVGNNAAHGGDETDFSKEDALRYRKFADEIIRQLQMQAAFWKSPLPHSEISSGPSEVS
jgi:hypothetical protein